MRTETFDITKDTYANFSHANYTDTNYGDNQYLQVDVGGKFSYVDAPKPTFTSVHERIKGITIRARVVYSRTTYYDITFWEIKEEWDEMTLTPNNSPEIEQFGSAYVNKHSSGIYLDFYVDTDGIDLSNGVALSAVRQTQYLYSSNTSYKPTITYHIENTWPDPGPRYWGLPT